MAKKFLRGTLVSLAIYLSALVPGSSESMVPILKESLTPESSSNALVKRCLGCLVHASATEVNHERWNPSQKTCVDAVSGSCSQLSI